MTIEECINRVDAVKPNQYSTEEKVRWLSYLDGSIKREIIDTHEKPEMEENTEFCGYTPEDLTVSLIAPFPYDELYVAYLKAKIDEENGETARYNNTAATFNSLMMDFQKAYNKEHLSLFRPFYIL